MFNVMGRKIVLEKSEILYDIPFSEASLKADFEIATGDWRLEGNWLTGKILDNGGGIIYLKNNYPGDIMLDFYGRTVAPSSHDLNFTWHSEGWDYEKNDAGISYIAGLNGWWTGKTGIEKYPKCDVQSMTSLLEFIPGRIYHIQAGTIGQYSFIFVDGKLAVEMKDTEPIDSSIYGKVGFGCYCSHVQFSGFRLYKLYTEKVDLIYSPEN